MTTRRHDRPGKHVHMYSAASRPEPRPVPAVSRLGTAGVQHVALARETVHVARASVDCIAGAIHCVAKIDLSKNSNAKKPKRKADVVGTSLRARALAL